MRGISEKIYVVEVDVANSKFIGKKKVTAVRGISEKI
jgi:hypothetical protein